MIDKNKLKRRFSKNASQYDQYAMVQKKMCNDLIEFVDILEPKNILEIGCGTGYLTELLLQKFKSASIKSVDIAPGMIEFARNKINDSRVEFKCMDVEEINDIEKYDLIISNATFQWFNDLSGTSKKLIDSLNEGGMLCFSTFGENTFNELKEAYEKTSKEKQYQESISPSQSFYSLAGLEQLYKDISTMKLESKESYEYEYFDSCVDFFQSVKKIGANNCQKERTKIDPNFVNRAIEIYEDEYRYEKGIRATYHNLYIKGQK